MHQLRVLSVRLFRHRLFPLTLLVIFWLGAHLTIITQSNQYIFDERYYIPDAKYNIAMAASIRYEHPPLAKLFIGGGIRIFGDNPWGWRLPTILFSLLSLILVYNICNELHIGRKGAFIATFLLALENLSFIHGGIAMLDPFMVFFMLLAFWYYLKGRFMLCAMAIALSVLCKMTGVLAVLPIALHWLATSRQKPWRFVGSLAAAVPVYLILDTLLEYTFWGRLNNPVLMTKDMITLTSDLTFKYFIQHVANNITLPTRPWDWVLSPHATYYVNPQDYSKMGHYVGMVSPALWVITIPVIIYIIWKSIKRHRAALFVLAWIIGTWVIWIPADMVTDRLTYIYYFLPTIGAICVGASILIIDLRRMIRLRPIGTLRRFLEIVLALYLSAYAGAFCIVSPVSLYVSIPLVVALLVFCIYYLGYSRDLKLGPLQSEGQVTISSREENTAMEEN